MMVAGCCVKAASCLVMSASFAHLKCGMGQAALPAVLLKAMVSLPLNQLAKGALGSSLAAPCALSSRGISFPFAAEAPLRMKLPLAQAGTKQHSFEVDMRCLCPGSASHPGPCLEPCLEPRKLLSTSSVKVWPVMNCRDSK